MSRILVYRLEAVLPTVVVKLDKQLILESVSPQKEITTIQSQINETLIEEQILNEFKMKENEENEPLEWLDKRKKLGDYGEDIAIQYLETVYMNVKNVANHAYLGFDIEVRDDTGIHAFEVKTSEQTRGFFISYNELEKAFKYKTRYNVFIIHILSETEVYGYIINDPVNYFELDFDNIIRYKESSKAYIMPSGFYIKYKDDIFSDLIHLDLSHFIK